MKIVSLTMVGNESEIIESFIRYNSHFIDKMIFVSTCCIDNTLLIIRNLISEGYHLELIVEPVISFEQRYLDNKYMKKIAREEDADLFIPLDVDEFLTGCGNPRTIMERLPMDRVYEVCWKNYAMSKDDDINEPFIPRRLVNFKINFKGNNVRKVMIPMKMILHNNVILGTGHHYVSGDDIRIEHINQLKMAHYPVTSKEQFKSRLYGNNIKFIIWTNRGNEDGEHINKQIAEIEEGHDIYRIANGYGLDDNENIEWLKEPLNLSYCPPNSLQMKYTQLAKVDFLHNINCIGQMMAVKSYNLERDAQDNKQLPTIMVYGTGDAAKNMLNGLPESCVNIRAYINSDPNKRFQMFNRRLVVSPEWIRFFVFDRIVISSAKYYDEMKVSLIKNGVEKEKICNVNYLFDLVYEESRK